MIQFNKTIFQFTKRLALVIALIGISHELYAWESHGRHYTQVQAGVSLDGETLTSAQGHVYVKEENDKVTTLGYTGPYAFDEYEPYKRYGDDTTNHPIEVRERAWKRFRDCRDEGTENASHDHIYYFYAKNQAGFLFDGWYNGNDYVSDTQENYACDPITAQETPTSTNWVQTYPNVHLMLTAKWVIPRVLLVEGETGGDDHTIEKTISVNDSRESTVPITFTLSDDKAANNFKLIIDGKEQATPDCTYETEGCHSYIAHIPVGNLVNGNTRKTVTLKSIYNGGVEGAETFKTIILTIEKDYTPRFEAEEEDYKFVVLLNNDNTLQGGSVRSDAEEPKYRFKPVVMNTMAEIAGDWKCVIEPNSLPSNAVFNIVGYEKDENGKDIKYSPIVEFKLKEGTFNVEATYSAILYLTPNVTANVGSFISPEGWDANKNTLTTPSTKSWNDYANGANVVVKKINLVASAEPTILINNKEKETINLSVEAKQESKEFGPYNYLANVNADGYILSNPNSKITFNALNIIKATKEIKTIVNCDMNPSLIPYTNTLTLSAPTGTSSERVEAQLEVNVMVGIARPENLTATPLVEEIENTNPKEYKYSVGLSWNPVYKATNYVISNTPIVDGSLKNTEWENISNTTGYIAQSKTASYTHENLTKQKVYEYYVTAVYVNADEKIVDNKTSELVKAYTDNVPGEISFSNAASTGLETGTDGPNTTFPYLPKRAIDVTAAFDASTKKVIMNRLYIFGLTVGNSISYAEAITPCYIYEQKDDITYQLVHTIGNINDNDKDSYFNVAANGQKFYFTGYCPFASCGDNYDENAVVHIKGSSQIDVYLDNVQLYARNRGSENVLNITKRQENWALAMDEIEADEHYEGYPVGSGAVFAFSSTSKTSTAPFVANIHIRGDYNILDGAPGMSIKLSGFGNDQTLSVSSSPIQILPTVGGGKDQYTTLIIDDSWNELNTNGSLYLKEVSGGTGGEYIESNDAPSIDLGNANSNVKINGGRISLNSSSTTRAIGFRYRTGSQNGVTMNFYGTGDYQTTGQVIFGDGTISNAAGNSINLKCPTNTFIDGGSYMCGITAGSTTNLYSSYDTQKAHVLHKISADITESVGTIENGLAVFKTELTTDGKDGFQVLMDNIFPMANYKTTLDGQEVYASLSGYFNPSTKYGHNSLAPEGTKVYLMLPQNGTISSYTGWSLCVPKVEKLHQNVGGDVDIVSTTGTTSVESTTKIPVAQSELKLTNRLLYAEVDDITQGVIKNLDLEGNDATIEIGHHVTNDAAYVINEKVYMLLPVVAGEWKMIVPPFDVHNVYAIESYPEETLKKVYGEEKKAGTGRFYITKVEGAQKAQARRMLDLLVYWMGYEKLDTDFFGAAGGYGPFVNTWINYEANAKEQKNGATIDGGAVVEGNYTPKIEQLFHFTGQAGSYPEGMKWYDANYYLYQSVDGRWELNSESNLVEIDWVEVKEQSTPRTKGTPNVIMRKGGFYSMQFPSGYTNTGWDYWNGKYILLEGYGPQEINGFSAINTLLGSVAAPPSGVQLYGNASFGKSSSFTHDHLYHTAKNDNGVLDLVRKTDEKVFGPIEGFAIGNLDATTQSMNDEGQIIQTQKIAKAIKMETGEVMYEVKTEILDDNPGLGSGVPTIMNGMSLIVEPTSEGLTITPIKEQHVMLFDANGKMIFSKHLSAEENVTLPTGVYVVRGEYEQVKAIKK